MLNHLQAVFTDNNSILSQKFCSNKLALVHASHSNISTLIAQEQGMYLMFSSQGTT